MSAPINTDDIQSLVFSGHSRFPESMAMGFALAEPNAAKASALQLVRSEISFGLSQGKRTKAAQMLLSSAGVSALGGPASLGGLDVAYTEGMVAPQRSRALGDAGADDPSGWLWRDSDVHMILLAYGTDSDGVESTAQAVRKILSEGWRPVFELPICSPKDRREAFGFRDGITAPRVDLGELNEKEKGVDLLAPGEILLGERTAAGTLTAPPPIGAGGSYVAIRQIEQDVESFWKFWLGQAKSEDEAVWLAAKAVGRWPNGMPVKEGAPRHQPTASEGDIMRPMSFAPDPQGLGCPIGAHIRRANPRDTLETDPKVSLQVVAQHRIIRRGRMFGHHAPAGDYPTGFGLPGLDQSDPDAPKGRGLLFMCLCSDLTRQFEFIQQTWLNNPQFADRRDESDPISSGAGVVADSRRFSVPAEPLRRRIHGLPHWSRVRAGGYFLLPGRDALERLLIS
jgi:Dyp-type peroxidase family